ncbi:uncharacterized protein LOC135395652 [Ornithodoros turicata]|uniref:uncharacterized protein LOC135395652 n=1 Tax=Ornithodoros turicata TaxID=34597 RepID=UPI00313A3450
MSESSEYESDVASLPSDSEDYSSEEIVLDDDPYSTDPLPLDPAAGRAAGEGAASESEPSDSDDTFGCLCTRCSPVEPDERRCCSSVDRVSAVCEGAGVNCITDHPLFNDICLRRELLVVYAPVFCRDDRRMRVLEPSDNRYCV